MILVTYTKHVGTRTPSLKLEMIPAKHYKHLMPLMCAPLAPVLSAIIQFTGFATIHICTLTFFLFLFFLAFINRVFLPPPLQHNRINRGMDINVTGVWEHNITGQGVTVVVVDDGVEHTHKDIQLNYVSRNLVLTLLELFEKTVGLLISCV